MDSIFHPTGVAGLLRRYPRLLWHGKSSHAPNGGAATGYDVLDAALPEGGWPRGALVELAVRGWGIGEINLLLPALLTEARAQRHIAWLAPPFVPYAPALTAAGLDAGSLLYLPPPVPHGELLWTVEKLLRAGVWTLFWPDRLPGLAARRLQLAAERGQATGVVLHTTQPGQNWEASCAALRLHLKPRPGGLSIQILKARGQCRARDLTVHWTSPG